MVGYRIIEFQGEVQAEDKLRSLSIVILYLKAGRLSKIIKK